jgi:hypothetical protein
VSAEIQLGPLNSLLGHLGASTQDLISRRAGKLYHYTDLNALRSIVEQSDLWLTHARYLNDAEEMNHGLNVAQRVISERRKRTDIPSDQKLFLRAVKYALLKRGLEDVYVACFCEEQNRLSQWRGYGGNGTGVELEFASQEFSAVSGPDCPVGLMRFWKVYYDLEKQRERVREILEFWWEKTHVSLDERVQNACDAIRFFVPTFKNHDFHEESEWRLIFTPGPNCRVAAKFRVARGMLVPYFSLRDIIDVSSAHMPQLPIQGVCIGPCGTRDLNVTSTQMLLRKHGYTEVPVKSSPTPLRA